MNKGSHNFLKYPLVHTSWTRNICNFLRSKEGRIRDEEEVPSDDRSGGVLRKEREEN